HLLHGGRQRGSRDGRHADSVSSQLVAPVYGATDWTRDACETGIPFFLHRIMKPSSTSGGTRHPAPAHRTLAAVAVLVVCAMTLPASMAGPSSGVSKEDCLALAERPGSAPLTLLQQCSAPYPRDA